MGGTRAIATTPIVGQPTQSYADVYVPGAEPIRDGEIRVTVLGSGNPPPTRAQASGSVLVEVGNAERDMFIFDVGSGALANFMSQLQSANDGPRRVGRASWAACAAARSCPPQNAPWHPEQVMRCLSERGIGRPTVSPEMTVAPRLPHSP